jgi:hypothetical protein
MSPKPTSTSSSLRKTNKYDMGGHAEKARQHLVEANRELKLAAETANAAGKKKK